MTIYTIELTETEDSALAVAAVSQNDWIQAVVRERCRIAADEIVQQAVQKCLDTAVQIPGTREEIVQLAFANGWVKTAAERQAEYEAMVAAQAESAPQE